MAEVPSKKYSCFPEVLYQRSPADNVLGCEVEIVAELTGTKSKPLYTFNLD